MLSSLRQIWIYSFTEKRKTLLELSFYSFSKGPTFIIAFMQSTPFGFASSGSEIRSRFCHKTSRALFQSDSQSAGRSCGAKDTREGFIRCRCQTSGVEAVSLCEWKREAVGHIRRSAVLQDILFITSVYFKDEFLDILVMYHNITCEMP